MGFINVVTAPFYAVQDIVEDIKRDIHKKRNYKIRKKRSIEGLKNKEAKLTAKCDPDKVGTKTVQRDGDTTTTIVYTKIGPIKFVETKRYYTTKVLEDWGAHASYATLTHSFYSVSFYGYINYVDQKGREQVVYVEYDPSEYPFPIDGMYTKDFKKYKEIDEDTKDEMVAIIRKEIKNAKLVEEVKEDQGIER